MTIPQAAPEQTMQRGAVLIRAGDDLISEGGTVTPCPHLLQNQTTSEIASSSAICSVSAL